MRSVAAAAVLAAGLTFAAPVDKRQGVGSSANDLQNGACKAVSFIFARGSTEGGNLGIVVGPPFASALKQAFGDGNVAVQGVEYPADISGAVTGAVDPAGSDGAKTMTSLAQAALQKCPNTKIVLSGYSQGAEVVHGTAQNLGSQGAQIPVAVTFGDPLKTASFGSIPASKVFCASGDGVCSGAFDISAAHLSYGSDVDDATQFVKQSIGSTSSSSGASSSTGSAPASGSSDTSSGSSSSSASNPLASLTGGLGGSSGGDLSSLLGGLGGSSGSSNLSGLSGLSGLTGRSDVSDSSSGLPDDSSPLGGLGGDAPATPTLPDIGSLLGGLGGSGSLPTGTPDLGSLPGGLGGSGSGSSSGGLGSLLGGLGGAGSSSGGLGGLGGTGGLNATTPSTTGAEKI